MHSGAGERKPSCERPNYAGRAGPRKRTRDMRWNRQSEQPSARHFVAMNRDGKRAYKARLRIARLRGAITSADEHVGQELARHVNSTTGRCDPSRSTLAREAGHCLRTVANALRRLKAAGMLEWTRRIVATREGAKQTSSAYRLLLDRALPAKRQKPEGKACLQTVSIDSQWKNKQRQQPHQRDPHDVAQLAHIAAERTAQLFSRRKPSMA
jgi:hypothetical protein